jgi:hypothetical protein
MKDVTFDDGVHGVYPWWVRRGTGRQDLHKTRRTHPKVLAKDAQGDSFHCVLLDNGRHSDHLAFVP